MNATHPDSGTLARFQAMIARQPRPTRFVIGFLVFALPYIPFGLLVFGGPPSRYMAGMLGGAVGFGIMLAWRRATPG